MDKYYIYIYIYYIDVTVRLYGDPGASELEDARDTCGLACRRPQDPKALLPCRDIVLPFEKH